jgi:cell filamentation protein, protein adenylyltransferase
LLREGRAVGAEQLSEYMEVVGYADAARWVYRQAIQPSAWNSDELITLAEIRQVHHAALTLVWDVTSHPEADPEEAPGNFRRHEIEPFLSGMQPPTWALVDSELAGWLAQARKLKARSDTSQRTSRCFTADSNRSIRFSTATVEPVA